MTQQAIAAKLQVNPKTVSRWQSQKTGCPVYVQAALWEILRSTSTGAEGNLGSFTFIDLFAGIGVMKTGINRLQILRFCCRMENSGLDLEISEGFLLKSFPRALCTDPEQSL